MCLFAFEFLVSSNERISQKVQQNYTGSFWSNVVPRRLESFPSKGVLHSLINRLELWERVTCERFHKQSLKLTNIPNY